MRIVEKTLIVLLALSIGMKLLLISNYELAIGLVSTVAQLFYLIFGFALFNNLSFRETFLRNSYQGIGAKRIFGGIFAGIGMMAFIVVVPFVLLALPGAEQMLTSSLFIGSIPLAVILIKYLSKKNDYRFGILKRLVIAGVIIGAIQLTPLETRTKFLFRDSEQFITAYINANTAPFTDEKNKELDQVREEYFGR